MTGAPTDIVAPAPGGGAGHYNRRFNPETGQVEITPAMVTTQVLNPTQEPGAGMVPPVIGHLVPPAPTVSQREQLMAAPKLTKGLPIAKPDGSGYVVPVFDDTQRVVRYENLDGTPIAALPTVTTAEKPIPQIGGDIVAVPLTSTTSRVPPKPIGPVPPSTAPTTVVPPAPRTKPRTVGHVPEGGFTQAVNNGEGATIGWVNPKSGQFRAVGGIPGISDALGGATVIPQKPMGQERSRAAAAVAITPLIQRVRELLRDPEVRGGLGVLPGRISEAEKVVGNLPPKVAELYGTLKSIYSLGGTMHGWRALQVAEEFEKAYGGLHTSPDTLLGGMDAMEGTARAIAAAGGKIIPGTPLQPPGAPTGNGIPQARNNLCPRRHNTETDCRDLRQRQA